MRTKSFLCILIALGFFSLIFLAPMSVSAALHSTDLSFETSDQNMWGGGSSFTISGMYSKGLAWDESYTTGLYIGGETIIVPGGCLPGWLGGGCWPAQTIDTTTGAQLSAESDGYIGIEAGYSIYSGSINASYPVAVDLTYPDPSTVSPGETFTISSQYVVDPSAGFDTNFSEIEAYVDLVFDVYAHVEAGAYVAGVGGTISETLIDEDFTTEIVGFNREGDNNLSILGDDYALGSEVGLTKYTDMMITIPDIETTSEESSTDPDTYTSTGEKEFLSMGWDGDTMVTQAIYNVARVAAAAAGIPLEALDLPDSFLAGDIVNFIYYDLLDIDVGLEWDIMQSFSWEPELEIDLTMGSETVSFLAGESIELEMPDSGFDITPTFVLNNTFTNNTDLAIVPEIELAYLYAYVPSLNLSLGPFPTDGPLELQLDEFIPTIPVYNNSFSLDFDPYTMASFSIAPLTGPGTEPVPEPATIILLGSGLIGLVGFRRRKKQKIN